MERYIRDFLKKSGDTEFIDLIDCYYKLAEDKIIYIEPETGLVAFRTYGQFSSVDYNQNFLRFVSERYPSIFCRETRRDPSYSTMNNIWFLHLCHLSSYIQAWIRTEFFQQRPFKRISFESGTGQDFDINSPEISNVLKASVKDHINILLTFKSMFFEDYKEYRKNYERY